MFYNYKQARANLIPMLDMQAKSQGAMLGTALGDAIGEIAFRNRNKQALLGEINACVELCYTDDTAMAISLAESLISMGDIDQQHLGETLRSRYSLEPWRGYGPGPSSIFIAVDEHGLSYVEAASKLHEGQGSMGNGAAMRIAPLAIWFHDSPLLYEKAKLSAEVTHTHPVGIDGAAVLAKAVAICLTLDPLQHFSADGFISKLTQFARTQQVHHKLNAVRSALACQMPPDAAAHQLGLGVSVQESLPFALYSFLRHPADFMECLMCAVLHGGDCDTVGAMAGAVCGGHVGIDGIPSTWRVLLEHYKHIEKLGSELIKRHCRAEPQDSADAPRDDRSTLTLH